MRRSSNPTLCWSVAAAGLLLAAQAHAAEGEKPIQLLSRMSQSNHSVSYEGVFVFAHGDQMQSVRITHGVDSHGEYEHLVTLSGKSREVVRNNGEPTRPPAGEKAGAAEQPAARRTITLNFIPDLDRINDNYQLQYRGSERIAERAADHVTALPRDHYRYGHGYWVDQESGLLLRADLIGEKGRIVEQMMFTSLRLRDNVPRKSVESPAQGAAQRADTSNKTAEGQWEAAALPPGFTLGLLRYHPMPGRTAPVEHHIYSDGLARVSVFIEPDDGAARGVLGHTLRGAVHAYGRVLDGKRIVAVGEVPAVTVEQIAAGMRPRQERQP